MDANLHVSIHKDKTVHQIPMCLGKYIKMTYFLFFFFKSFEN